MREIKFRAWDKAEKRMVDGHDVMLWGSGSWGACREGNEELSSDGVQISDDPYTDRDMVLMEYTGLKDKTGKEIFEGDIVLCQFATGKEKNIIEYKDGCFWVSQKEILRYQDKAYDSLFWHYADCEVVGNIYENPELVKGKTA
jgi:uncharacterized phage protein (TIGR01671 family)